MNKTKSRKQSGTKRNTKLRKSAGASRVISPPVKSVRVKRGKSAEAKNNPASSFVGNMNTTSASTRMKSSAGNHRHMMTFGDSKGVASPDPYTMSWAEV